MFTFTDEDDLVLEGCDTDHSRITAAQLHIPVDDPRPGRPFTLFDMGSAAPSKKSEVLEEEVAAPPSKISQVEPVGKGRKRRPSPPRSQLKPTLKETDLLAFRFIHRFRYASNTQLAVLLGQKEGSVASRMKRFEVTGTLLRLSTPDGLYAYTLTKQGRKLIGVSRGEQLEAISPATWEHTRSVNDVAAQLESLHPTSNPIGRDPLPHGLQTISEKEMRAGTDAFLKLIAWTHPNLSRQEQYRALNDAIRANIEGRAERLSDEEFVLRAWEQLTPAKRAFLNDPKGGIATNNPTLRKKLERSGRLKADMLREALLTQRYALYCPPADSIRVLPHRPDLVVMMQTPSGETSPIAIEVELTVKTRQRWKDTFSGYKASIFGTFFYLLPHTEGVRGGNEAAVWSRTLANVAEELNMRQMLKIGRLKLIQS